MHRPHKIDLTSYTPAEIRALMESRFIRPSPAEDWLAAARIAAFILLGGLIIWGVVLVRDALS